MPITISKGREDLFARKRATPSRSLHAHARQVYANGPRGEWEEMGTTVVTTNGRCRSRVPAGSPGQLPTPVPSASSLISTEQQLATRMNPTANRPDTMVSPTRKQGKVRCCLLSGLVPAESEPADFFPGKPRFSRKSPDFYPNPLKIA